MSGACTCSSPYGPACPFCQEALRARASPAAIHCARLPSGPVVRVVSEGPPKRTLAEIMKNPPRLELQPVGPAPGRLEAVLDDAAAKTAVWPDWLRTEDTRQALANSPASNPHDCANGVVCGLCGLREHAPLSEWATSASENYHLVDHVFSAQICPKCLAEARWNCHEHVGFCPKCATAYEAGVRAGLEAAATVAEMAANEYSTQSLMASRQDSLQEGSCLSGRAMGARVIDCRIRALDPANLGGSDGKK